MRKTAEHRTKMRYLRTLLLGTLFLAGCTQQSGNLPVINSFSASDRVITSGDTSTLSWNVDNATSLKITADTGKHVGDVTGQESKDVTHNETTVHTLTATNEAGSVSETVTVNALSVNYPLPSDIPGGAQEATLEDAATFAWHEFIALNWPAQAGARDTPNQGGTFGSAGPVVWETFRHKSEIYPGTLEAPHGPDYNDPPQYIYSPESVGPSTGEVPPCGQASATTPFINLDEQSEIGLDQMFAGSGPGSRYDGQQLLFLAKANKVEYDYAFSNKWYGTDPGAPFEATADYVTKNQASPPPGSSDYVSFPYGTIEIKAAWRKLTSKEASSGRFYTAPVRYYQYQSGPGSDPCYVDEATGWGLVALHIIQKTPTAPYFIYATFGQADNMKTETGEYVEDENGNLMANQTASPLDPNITSQNATASAVQQLSPNPANSMPGERLYYSNTPENTGEPQGLISINKRIHDIPETIIDVNQTAHQAISAYNTTNGLADSPWLYYKLVNVQYQPIDKPTPGVDYTGDDAATYYQANIVVETDYNLQVFSGKFQLGPDGKESDATNGLITDFNTDGSPTKNVYYGDHGFNMGGCMGCHGNAQVAGSDFSFIISGVGQFNLAPDVGSADVTADIDKFTALLLP